MPRLIADGATMLTTRRTYVTADLPASADVYQLHVDTADVAVI